MPRRIIVYVYLAAVICSVSYAEDEKVRVFNNDESRIDFANLLGSLVKLNEQRISVIKKMNNLEDYEPVREVLRSSGDPRHRANEGHNNRNLLIFIVSNNQSKPSRRNVPFMDSVDLYYDNVDQYRNPETRKWYYTQEKNIANPNHQRNRFKHSRRNHETDKLRIPIMYRDGFQLNAENDATNEYISESNRYPARRQGGFKIGNPQYGINPYRNPITHDNYNTGFNINPPSHHRVDEDIISSEHDSLSNEYKTTANFKVTRGIIDFEPVTERKIFKNIEPVLANIDEKSLEKHNNKFLRKMKKQKLPEPHKRKVKSSLQIDSKHAQTDINLIETNTKNIGNYDQFSNVYEQYKVTTEPETNYKHVEDKQFHPESKSDFPGIVLSVNGKRDQLIRYSEPDRGLRTTRLPFDDKDIPKSYFESNKDFQDTRLETIERQDKQKIYSEPDKDFSVTESASYNKHNNFKRYPESYKNYETTGIPSTEKHDKLKSIPNQLVPQLDSLLPEIEINKSPHNFNNTFDHSDPPKKISLTGFGMFDNEKRLKNKQTNREFNNDYFLPLLNNDEKLIKLNVNEGSTEPHRGFAPLHGALSNKQDIYKSVHDRLPPMRPVKSHPNIQKGLNNKHDKLRQGRHTYADKVKDIPGGTIKLVKHGKLRDKHERDQSDDDISKPALHFAESFEDLQNKDDYDEHDTFTDALRMNSDKRKSWQICMGKKALKKCRKACNNAYKSVCRRLKCTSRSKKDLKKECQRSCKDSFGKSHSSESKSSSCGSY